MQRNTQSGSEPFRQAKWPAADMNSPDTDRLACGDLGKPRTWIQCEDEHGPRNVGAPEEKCYCVRGYGRSGS